MKGTNTMTLNAETMREAVEYWLNRDARIAELEAEVARLEALIVRWFVKQSGAPADALVGEALRVIRDCESGSRMPDPREKE